MTRLDVIERFFDGEFVPLKCATEPDYYAAWHAHGLDKMPPTDSAIVGGLLADRLPWVFTAGYQATLHNAFKDLPTRGWAAFAATEDRDNPSEHPGTTLLGDGDQCRLNGCKSWVAHSKIVDHLIITVNDPAGDKRQARGVIVDRGAAGVNLSHRETPGFLAAMSQGFARFDDTPVDPAAVFEFEMIRQFGRTEAKFVMLSAAAFMLGHADQQTTLRHRLVSLCTSLLALINEAETSRQVYAAIDLEFQHCADAFEAIDGCADIPDFSADRRLFRMYTAKIQRRGGYARAERR